LKISIIIPTYNEANAVRNVLDQLIHGKYHQKYEIIFVNDGSIDKTADIIKEYPVILYNHHVNKGYGASIKTGIGKSKGDKIIILDSDGQHDPNYIDEIVTLLNQYDMVIGNRDEKSYQVKSRQAGKKLIRFVGEYLLEQKLPDYNSGFRGFDKKLINKMLHILPNGFSFSTTSTLALILTN
jgi:glycosyltransferase involved in cell wall biosynthesis